MKRLVALLSLAALYAFSVSAVSDYLHERPLVEKVGYTPDASLFVYGGGDQQLSVSAALVMKTLFYYGTLVEVNLNSLEVPVDYFGMYKALVTANALDPYNFDTYYFAQAILTWDVGRIEEANAFLEAGMQKRTWDWMLPFFAGFNAAYFQRDYEAAAKYYRRAAELSGVDLYSSLAGRYMYEAGRTDLALGYLRSMEAGARNESIRQTYAVRISALEAIRTLENALERFKEVSGRLPTTLPELVSSDFLPSLPIDPYGGTFYLDEAGRVRTTSQLASVIEVKEGEGNNERH